MANDCIPYQRPGEDLPCQATAAVTGKRFVKVSADITSGPGLSNTAEGSNYRVNHCGATEHAVGVAKYDAPSGGKVGVVRAGVVPVTAGATVTFGQAVQSDANGKAIALAAGPKVGVAMSGGVLDADLMVALMLA